jgi:hypothetical protein
MVVLVAVAILMGTREASNNQFDPEVFPVTALDWLDENHIEGEMFNFFNWGGYILYRQWPEHPVFIDGQTDFYGESFSQEYVHVIDLDPDWQSILTRYEVSWAILPTGFRLVDALIHELGWNIIYEDPTAVILVRP